MQNELELFRAPASGLMRAPFSQNEAGHEAPEQAQQGFTPTNDWRVSINHALQADAQFENIRTLFAQATANGGDYALLCFVNMLPAQRGAEVASFLRQQQALPAAAFPSLLATAISERAWPTVTFIGQATTPTSESSSLLNAALDRFIYKGNSEGVIALLKARGASLPDDISSWQLEERAIACGHERVAVAILQQMVPTQTVEASSVANRVTSTLRNILFSTKHDASDQNRQQCLSLANQKKMLDVEVLIQERCAGFTPEEAADLLVRAIDNNRPIAAQIAIKWGADPNLTTTTGSTLLMQACEKGHTAVAEVLIEKGAALDAQDSRECTALSISTRRGAFLDVKLLLERGASVSLGHLKEALALGQEEIFELLFEGRARSEMDISPLLKEAVTSGSLKIVKLLFEAGAHSGMDISLLLADACSGGYLEVARFLLAQGASAKRNDNASKAALDEAFIHMLRPIWDRRVDPRFNVKEAVELVELLLANGATLTHFSSSSIPFLVPIRGWEDSENSQFGYICSDDVHARMLLSSLSDNAHTMMALSIAKWPVYERQKWLSLPVKNETGAAELYIDHLCHKELLPSLFEKIGGIKGLLSDYEREKSGQPFSTWFKRRADLLAMRACRESKKGDTAFLKEVIAVSFALSNPSQVFMSLYVGIKEREVSGKVVLEVLQELGLCEWDTLSKWLNKTFESKYDPYTPYVPFKSFERSTTPASCFAFIDCLSPEELKHLFADKGSISKLLEAYTSSKSHANFRDWVQANLTNLIDQAFLAAANKNLQGHCVEGDKGAYLEQVLTLARGMFPLEQIKSRLKAKMQTSVIPRDLVLKVIGNKLGSQENVDTFLREVDGQLEA